jgi:hypothetical protein
MAECYRSLTHNYNTCMLHIRLPLQRSKVLLSPKTTPSMRHALVSRTRQRAPGATRAESGVESGRAVPLSLDQQVDDP